MKVAALDLGSNTFLLLIAELEAGRIKRVICDETRVVRLGQGVNSSGRLHPEALVRAENCFREYQELIDMHQPEKIVAVATSAARDAENGADFIRLGRQYNIPIQIIPGEEEAAITFLGASFDQPVDQEMVVVDIGGGSTEIIGRAGPETFGHSINIGSVRLTELFLSQHPIPAEELARLRIFIEQEIVRSREALPSLSKQGQIIAVAGTPTSLACLDLGTKYHDQLVHGYRLSLEKVEFWIKTLAGMSVAQREALPGMPPKRSEVLVAGACILAEVMKFFRVPALVVSTKGVRFGLVLSWQKYSL